MTFCVVVVLAVVAGFMTALMRLIVAMARVVADD